MRSKPKKKLTMTKQEETFNTQHLITLVERKTHNI